MTAVASVIAFGILTPMVWAGFANFGIAVVAVATAPAVLMRPTLAPRTAFFVAGGFLLVAAYNWYPIALVGGVALVVAACRLWAAARSALERRTVELTVSVAVVAMAAPIAFTLHIGAEAALAAGGIPQAPRSLVVLSSLGLVAAVIARTHAVGQRSAGLALGSLGALGFISVFALVAYQVSSAGQVMYYAEKLATGVAAASVIAIALVATEAMARSRERSPTRARGLVAMAALASFALVQLSGYVGPEWQRVADEQAAVGFHVHQGWLTVRISDEAGTELVATAEAVQDLAASEPGSSWSYLDIDNVEPVPDLADIWFGALVGNLDSLHIRRSLALGVLNQPDRQDMATAADALEKAYPRLAGRDLRLVGPEPLVEELVRRGAPWDTPRFLWVRSSNGVRPAVPDA